MKNYSRLIVYPIAIIGVLLMLTYGCKKKPVPILNTAEVAFITQNTATCGGTITSDAGLMVTSRGICWSTDSIPSKKDSFTIDGKGAGSFVSIITGLKPNTTYYARAYATNSAGTGYGSTMSFTTNQLLTDFDGNIYHSITIGTQVWMVENLKVTHYRNGELIPNVTNNKEWSKLKTGAYCDYENSPEKGKTYGKLYNWYTIVDPRNICLTGWHIPTDAEWETLSTYLGGRGVTGGKLKEMGTTHWKGNNKDAKNDSGFTALPGGNRGINGKYYQISDGSNFWSTTEHTSSTAWTWYIHYNHNNVLRAHFYKICGFSVRCIKDK
jgi:uncharacterized protein (TIGR02145 family)